MWTATVWHGVVLDLQRSFEVMEWAEAEAVEVSCCDCVITLIEVD